MIHLIHLIHFVSPCVLLIIVATLLLGTGFAAAAPASRCGHQHIAGGLALWSVVGQIWLTWYFLGNLALIPLLIDDSHLLLIIAVMLVIVNDAQSFVTSQESPAEQPHNTHAKRLTTSSNNH